eukprot:11178319-Ditylum_brightwellii.AAC.1
MRYMRSTQAYLLWTFPTILTCGVTHLKVGMSVSKCICCQEAVCTWKPLQEFLPTKMSWCSQHSCHPTLPTLIVNVT